MAWELVEDTIYSDGKTYRGPAEECSFGFELGPEQLDWLGGNWVRDRLISAAKSSVEEQGAKILRLTVYRDTAPTWTTPYNVIITASASPLWWNLIIAAIFILLILVVIAFIIYRITPLDWGALPKTAMWLAIGGIGIGTLVLAVTLARRK